jgi:hypothetical protein
VVANNQNFNNINNNPAYSTGTGRPSQTVRGSSKVHELPKGGPPQSANRTPPQDRKARPPNRTSNRGNRPNSGGLLGVLMGGGNILSSLLGGGSAATNSTGNLLGSLLGGGGGSSGGGLGNLGALLGGLNGGGGAGGLGNIVSALGGLSAAMPATTNNPTPTNNGPDIMSILSALNNNNPIDSNNAATNTINPQDLLTKLSSLMGNVNNQTSAPLPKTPPDPQPGPGALPDQEIIVNDPHGQNNNQTAQLNDLLSNLLTNLDLSKLTNLTGGQQQKDQQPTNPLPQETQQPPQSKAAHKTTASGNEPKTTSENAKDTLPNDLFASHEEPIDPCSDCPHPCWNNKEHLPSFAEVKKMASTWSRY